MSNVLRRFNEAGIVEFVRRIQAMRSGEKAEIDDAFVMDPSLTDIVKPEVTMERPAFKTKRDAGAYLSEKTREARRVLGDQDAGLWTWLSAWHWDAVCPVKPSSGRRVLSPYNYVLGYGNVQDRKKHLLWAAVLLAEVAPRCRLVLDTPVATLTQVVQEVCTRVSLTRIRALFDVLDVLYLNPHTGKAKSGIVDTRKPKPGDLRHRLPLRVQQLELTHDLTDLTADQLLALLGEEFQQWASPPKKNGGGGGGPRRPRVPVAH